jgi:hypothetical protein
LGSANFCRHLVVGRTIVSRVKGFLRIRVRHEVCTEMARKVQEGLVCPKCKLLIARWSANFCRKSSCCTTRCKFVVGPAPLELRYLVLCTWLRNSFDESMFIEHLTTLISWLLKPKLPRIPGT